MCKVQCVLLSHEECSPSDQYSIAVTMMTIVKYWLWVSEVFAQSFIAISCHREESKERGGNYSTNPSLCVILVHHIIVHLKVFTCIQYLEARCGYKH